MLVVVVLVLLTALTPPLAADFFAAAARRAPAPALAFAFDFSVLLALARVLAAVFALVLAFALGFRLTEAALRAFLLRAGEALDFDRALGRVLALDRDAAAALDLFDRFLAMMVAAGKGFRRASQSGVMI
ncbi:hypothetical protein [Undibacter mobilis]|uniref:hypothetical protein n=1 Tax=Undibacter mobilis TaxID=2292256 RepID=UPI00143E0AA6|nr:hypothetical protein [Undibacter mobilis]